MRLPSLSLSVPSAAALLILGLPLLAEAMALQRVRMGAIDGQVVSEGAVWA